MNENKDKLVRKCITDLGIAAFVSMHGFKFCGRKGKNIFFDVKENDINDFDKLCFEYFSSACAVFDDHLMKLKKLNDYLPDLDQN